jgi:hypothetical protein
MGMVGFGGDSLPIFVAGSSCQKARSRASKLAEERVKTVKEDRWIGGVASPLGTDVISRPREVGEFHDFYKRWGSQIFAFGLLVCGDREKAEWLTEETFALYFRGADSVAVRNRSRIPVALLRFASDLGKTHCSQRWGMASCGLAQSLLGLPFKDRATFILVSILRVQPSAAAVALRLRRSQLAAYWIRSALRLRWFWLRTGDLREAQSAA